MLKQRDFDFIKMIGAGTFGKVFLSKFIKTNKYIAIKRMDKRLLKINRQLDNVYNEARIIKNSKSPFIVKFICFIETDYDVFLGMEYVKAGELFYYLKSHGKFNMDAVLFFASEILLAINYLHERDILYRDLKPENILITEVGHIKLVDFGFATKINDNVYHLCGTPEYMAPEKLLGNGDSKETDYWAFGCLIYEMLTGEPPFYGNTVDDIYKKILADDIFLDALNEDTRDFISRLLRKDREFRLGSQGIQEIFEHPFFKNVNWDLVSNLKVEPPFQPVLYQFQIPEENQNERVKSDYKPVHTYKRIFHT